MFQSLSSSPFNHQFLSPGPFSPFNHLFANLVSAFNGLQVSNLGLVTVYWGPGTGVLPSLGCVASTWALPGYPLKIIKFQACLQDPQKSEKVTPRSPKGVKMTPKTSPWDINLLNKWKK